MTENPPSFYLKEIESTAAALAAASHRFAEASLRQAFSQRFPSVPGSKPKTFVAGSGPQPRRSPKEMARLCDALESAIDAGPGRAIGELAVEVDSTPALLASVIARLKHEGRIHKVGVQQNTRYFPGSAATQNA